MYNKEYHSPRLPQRAALKPNLYHGGQDPSNFEAKTSVDHQSKESEEDGEPVAIALAPEKPKSSVKPGAVISTSEYKVYHSQLFQSRMTFAEKLSTN